MDLIREVFAPDFLLRNSVYISLLIGLACPLVGIYLVLRRLVFLGVALPQVSSCGIAFAFAFHTWGWLPHFEGESALAFAGSTFFTLGTTVALSVAERRGRGLVEGRLGLVYVLAGAWSILLLVKNPFGEHGLLDRLKGEIIAISNFDLVLTAVTFAVVALLLILFRREFILVSFDREMALTLRKRVFLWDFFLFALIGLTISVAVLSVGPLVTFGFLLIPPLIAYQVARTMAQFAWLASLIGGGSALIGFCISYRWDLPVGPTDIALLGGIYGVVRLGRFQLSIFNCRFSIWERFNRQSKIGNRK